MKPSPGSVIPSPGCRSPETGPSAGCLPAGHKFPGFFHPDTGEMVNEIFPCFQLVDAAEIIGGDIDHVRNGVNADLVHIVFIHIGIDPVHQVHGLTAGDHLL